MEVIDLGLGNTASCPDELITDEKQYYRILIRSSIILGCFLSGKSQARVKLTNLGICLRTCLSQTSEAQRGKFNMAEK